MGSRVLVAELVAVVAFASNALAQCEIEVQSFFGLTGADAPVHAAEMWDPDGSGPQSAVLAVAGQFSLVGTTQAGRVATFDEASGQWSPVGQGFVGTARALLGMPNGDLIAGGSFTVADGQPCNRLARFDGQGWSQIGGGLSGSVHALALMPNGDLIVGGRFSSAGGVPCNNIAKWDGTSWSPLGAGVSWPGGYSPRVKALAVMPNGDVVAGGWFTEAGGVNAVGVARWNGSSWSAVGGSVNSGVEALQLLPNGDLVVGGHFGTAGGQSAPAIAKWDGAAWSSFGLGLRSGVSIGRVDSLIALPSGEVYVHGLFDLADGQPVRNVAHWNGTSWQAMGIGVDNNLALQDAASALAMLPSGDVVVGGRIYNAGGSAARNLARWDGATWSTLGTGGIDEGINAAMRLANGDLLVGGSFATIGGVLANRIARFDGTTWSPLGAGTDGRIFAVAELPTGDIVAAGTFAFAGGSPAEYVARWDGTQWSPMAGIDSSVNCLHVTPSGELWAGGTFAGGIARYVGGGVGWQVPGGGVGGWTGIHPHVHVIRTLPGGELVVGGRFGWVGSSAQPTSGVARFDGANWHTLGLGVQSEVICLEILDDGILVVGGDVLSAGGVVTPGIAQWDGAGWQALGGGITFPLGGAVWAMHALPGGDLLVGGSFSQAEGQPARGLARWNGVSWSEVVGVVSGGAPAAFARTAEDHVVAAGWFTQVGGVTALSLAELQPACPATVVDLGGGCAGHALAATERPWAGGTFRARGTGFAPLSLVSIIYGFTPTSIPLASLLPQGLPGCDLLVTPDYVEFGVGGSGAAVGTIDTALSIPPSSALVGVVIEHQLNPFEVDPNLNVLAVTATNSLQATLGIW